MYIIFHFILNDKKGKSTLEFVILLFLICVIWLALTSMHTSLNEKVKRTNFLEYEGMITSKYKDVLDDNINYIIKVSDIKGNEIAFEVNGKEYNALQPGYYIKYVSYQLKDKEKINYALGTKDALDTIILIALPINSPDKKE